MNKAIKKYIKHNKQIFSDLTQYKKKKPVVLCEFNNMHSCIIAYSYITTVLSKLHKAKIVAYQPFLLKNKFRRYVWHIKKILNYKEFALYRSFGTSSFLLPNINKEQKKQAKIILNDILTNIKTKSDIEAIEIDGIVLGDLFYDSYLRYFEKPTIDIQSDDFKNSLLNSIQFFIFWRDYFYNNTVMAVNVSHCVYNTAIPVRIAVNKDVPVFQSNTTHVYKLSKKNIFAYNDVKFYKERFEKQSKEKQRLGLVEAKERIERRFSGEIGVDMRYSKKTAYGDVKKYRLINESPRKKILIAAHCFFDSPHSYGLNLFPDFYEWLDFLGKISMETDYDWYIKTHPDYIDGTKKIIEMFVDKYKKFNLLPSDSSHNQIVSEGIDVALTVYGTIGFEYAALGIPVINASLNNPHIAYDFNIHPKNIHEYRDLLMDIENLEHEINIQEVYEFYYMKYIYNTNNWLFNNYDRTIDNIGGYRNQFKECIYSEWISEWSISKHEDLLSMVNKFVSSNDFRMSIDNSK